MTMVDLKKLASAIRGAQSVALIGASGNAYLTEAQKLYLADLAEQGKSVQPEAQLIKDAAAWREHQEVMRAATMPDALHIRLTMNEGAQAVRPGGQRTHRAAYRATAAAWSLVLWRARKV